MYMRFFTFFLCLMLISSSFASGKSLEKRVWVVFSDKGNYSISGNVNISERSLARRRKSNCQLIDNYDLPIYEPYISQIENLGAKIFIQSKWLNSISIEASEDVVSKIRKLPFVESIEPVAIYKRQYPAKRQRSIDSKLAPERDSLPNIVIDQFSDKYYGMSLEQISQINVNALHNKGFHGEGITIAVLDTGFDLSHTAFKNIRVIGEYDFVNKDNITLDEYPQDDIGQDDHGTEVLSLLAGYDPGGFIGVAFNADFLLAKTEKVSDKGVFFEQMIEEDWWVAGLEWAEALGADIVSSSLGYSDWYSYNDMDGMSAKTTIAANIAVEKGVAVVVSAGNEGKSNELPYICAPSDGFDVIAVGAVNSKGEVTDFSSIGPTYDGRIKPDLMAMGDGNYVVDPNNKNGYRKASGTSMSAPLVAGAMALLKQALPNINNPRTLAKLMKYTASKALNPDNRYGWGIVNAEAAFRFANVPGSIKELINWDPDGIDSYSQKAIIYPNPVSKNRLNIHSLKSISCFEVYTVTGALVYKRDDLDHAKFLTWDLQNQDGYRVASGIYLIVVKYSDKSIYKAKVAVVN
ncbi:MAG: S8 family peptidase [bacterium]